MIGRKIGHYRIEEQIGSGAMGVVYRARDERLRRDVALKFLPPHTLFNLASRQRFRREALALSRLNHPTVAVLHDFISEGDAECIVMEFITGESLDRMIARGAIPEREALRLATQLADGLSAAHRAGVIHRDLKPGNLRVTSDGRLKILDFGLAKRVVGTVLSDSTSATEADMVMGTLPYIAPELWKGEPASEASDLYAAGVVLYEMVTGSRPFPDLMGSALQHAVMNVPVPPPRSRRPELSAELEAIILRCLERNPAARFTSAEELRVALESLQSSHSSLAVPRGARGPRVSRAGSVVLGVCIGGALLAGWLAARPHGIRSLAVLPLANLSGDPAQEYFADGMTDELIARLSEQPSLRVISRTSMMRYKQTRKRLTEIASELGVEGVVQGSIQTSGDKVRISVQLIDGRQDRQLWGDQFEGSRRDVIGIQSQLAAAIAQEIGIELRPDDDRVAAVVDAAAYQLYLQGRFELNRRTPESIRRAITYFTRAIEHDTTYALAYAGLADAWSIAGLQAVVPRAESYPRARQAAEKALRLDDRLSEAYVSLANIQQNYDWDWESAGQAYRRAIRLNRNNAVAHHWYANHLALRGRFGPARAEIRRARELDPLSLPIGVGAGAFLYFERRYDDARAELETVAQLDSSSSLVQRALAATYDRLGRPDAAATAVRRWLAAESPAAGEAVSRVYAQSGFNGMIRFLIAATQARRSAGYEPASRLAELYARIGDRENAFRWLEVAFEERDTELNRLKVDPIFDSLRTDPRYEELLRRIGLADGA